MHFARQRKALPYIGFSLFILVDILSFHSNTAFSGFESFNDMEKNLYFFVIIASRITAFAVIALVTFRLAHTSIKLIYLVIPCSIASCLGLVLIIYATIAGKIVALIGGTIIFGMAQGTMSLFWLSFLISFDYRTNYLYILSSHVLATITCALLLFFLIPQWLPLAMIACLIIGAVLLSFISPQNQGNQAVSSQIKNVVPRLSKGLFLVCLFAFISGFMFMVSDKMCSGTNPVIKQYMVLAISSFVLIVMIVPTVIFKQPLKIEDSYKAAFPLSAFGFLMLPEIIELFPSFIAGTLVTMGYMMTGILLACTIAETARNTLVPGLPLFAGTRAMTLLLYLLGMISGSYLAGKAIVLGVDLVIIGSVGLYLIVLGIPWIVFKNRTTSHVSNKPIVRDDILLDKESSKDEEVSRQSPLKPVLSFDKLAKEKQFTHLDCVIFTQLLEGRSIPRIAQDLYLSTGSVKYHTQKIYRSLNVHSRSELKEYFSRIQQLDE